MTLDQGSTQFFEIAGTNALGAAVDISAWTIDMQVRRTYPSAIEFEISTSNGKMTLYNPSGGIARGRIDPSDTIGINTTGNDAFLEMVYDCEAVDTTGALGIVDAVYKLARGPLVLNRELTRVA